MLKRFDPIKAESSLHTDSKRYAELAVSLGATGALAIEAGDITLDERVRLKCAAPACFCFGTCANCPPHLPSVQEMRRVVSLYRMAVVFRREIPGDSIVYDPRSREQGVLERSETVRIVGALESAAFHDGHHLAMGFGAGSCKRTFCRDTPCAVLERKRCPHSLVARPSMEAVGIDCYGLACRLGWTIYPVGRSATASQVPAGMRMGLVLVG